MPGFESAVLTVSEVALAVEADLAVIIVLGVALEPARDIGAAVGIIMERLGMAR